MKTLIIYTTTSGNTQAVAEAIADALRGRGPAELITADDIPTELPDADLVFVGGPTEGHGMTRPMSRMLERVRSECWDGRLVAAFDTRLSWPRILSGSAAVDIVKRLAPAGARPVVDAESFIVNMKPQLEPGERERAASWALDVADAAEARLPVLA